MKTWIVSSLDEEIIQGGETIQGRKLYEEIRYTYILSLGQHAVDIFEGLEKESESLQNRTQDLNKRIVSVEETLKVRLFISSHPERVLNFELEMSKSDI